MSAKIVKGKGLSLKWFNSDQECIPNHRVIVMSVEEKEKLSIKKQCVKNAREKE